MYAWTLEGQIATGSLSRYARSEADSSYDGLALGDPVRISEVHGCLVAVPANLVRELTRFDSCDWVTLTDPATNEHVSYALGLD